MISRRILLCAPCHNTPISVYGTEGREFESLRARYEGAA